MYTFDLAYFVSSLSDCEQLFIEKYSSSCTCEMYSIDY